MITIRKILKFVEYWKEIQQQGPDLYLSRKITSYFKDKVYTRTDVRFLTEMVNYFLKCKYISLESFEIKEDLIEERIGEFITHRNKKTRNQLMERRN